MGVRKFKILCKDNILHDVETAEWVIDQYEPIRTKFVYLGSLINPSGKYYTPFAAGNVDPCPRCHGKGQTKKPKACEYCKGKGKRKYPMHPDLKDKGLIPCHVCNGTGKVFPTCRWCAGLGSREAYLDELFWERLEEEASALGGYITAGEGDPCDTFFAVSEDMDYDEWKAQK